MSSTNDPKFITGEQIEAVYAALGLDPAQYPHTTKVLIYAKDEVHIERSVVDEHGKPQFETCYGATVFKVEVSTIPINWYAHSGHVEVSR